MKGIKNTKIAYEREFHRGMFLGILLGVFSFILFGINTYDEKFWGTLFGIGIHYVSILLSIVIIFLFY